ncbi:MAG: FAD-dependent oxidoreductase [Candidatus Levybacteria bacterium]|nr:FAD-dependent oxidoreductase [Candidatus Levybacteria bacterium]
MYDLIIVGTGPAGLTASIYASCFHLNHVVLGKVLGGQMSLAHNIINYPGFESITGAELTEKMAAQVKGRGGEIISDSVVEIKKIEQGFEIITESQKTYQTKSIILATGMERRKLNIKGEAEYTGKGIIYCAPCDKYNYADKIAVVVGGGNSAATSAITVAGAASKVYLIYRGSQLRCDPMWLEQLKADPKIEVVYESTVLEILGDGEKLTSIRIVPTLSNNPNPLNPRELPVDKLFIEIGGVPGTALLIPLGVEVDPGGFIKVNDNLATNVAGIFAAGDVINYKLSIEQISTAVGLGAMAATSTFAYLKGQKPPTLWGESQIKR